MYNYIFMFFFFFFFSHKNFICLTVQRAHMQSKLWRTRKTIHPIRVTPSWEKPVLPRRYGMGPTANPNKRNQPLPVRSSKTLAAALRPFRQIRNLNTKAQQESIRKTLQRPPKTKESRQARKENKAITTRTPGRTV